MILMLIDTTVTSRSHHVIFGLTQGFTNGHWQTVVVTGDEIVHEGIVERLIQVCIYGTQSTKIGNSTTLCIMDCGTTNIVCSLVEWHRLTCRSVHQGVVIASESFSISESENTLIRILHRRSMTTIIEYKSALIESLDNIVMSSFITQTCGSRLALVSIEKHFLDVEAQLLINEIVCIAIDGGHVGVASTTIIIGSIHDASYPLTRIATRHISFYLIYHLCSLRKRIDTETPHAHIKAQG